MSDAQRLHKVLADFGFGSRRQIESWIEARRITVNGVAAERGQRWSPGDRVAIDGKPALLERPRVALPRVLAYNKPEGEICSRRDPEGRPSVFDALPRLRAGRWVLVGRLDVNTSGLLLITDSGELANRLMHPGANLEREYRARVLGPVDEDMLARLREGIALDDGVAAFEDVRAEGGSGANSWFAVVLREGRNREVRRLWESQGVRVSRLKRVRFGPVTLGPRERRGTWRELDAGECAQLCRLVGLEQKPLVPEKPSPVAAVRSRATVNEAGAKRRGKVRRRR